MLKVRGQARSWRLRYLVLFAEFATIALAIRINLTVELLALFVVSVVGEALLGPRRLQIDGEKVEVTTNLMPPGDVSPEVL